MNYLYKKYKYLFNNMVLIGEVFVMAGSFSCIFFILICMINVQAKEERRERRERIYWPQRNKLKKNIKYC